MTELIGFLGGIAFAVAFLPQLIKAYKTKKAKDVSWGLIGLSTLGNICMLVYVILAGKCSWVFVADYGGSLVLTAILCLMKLYYDNQKENQNER